MIFQLYYYNLRLVYYTLLIKLVTLQRKKRIQIVSGEKADLGDKKDNQIKTYFSRDKYQLESRKC